MSHNFCNNDKSIVIANSFNTTSRDDKSEILAWLSPLDPRVRHRDIGVERVDSIGEWLLETKEFRRWHSGCTEDESNPATLFCDGNPGVGKSYICSLVIDRLCDEAEGESTAVACFYFDFAAQNDQSPVNMLGSLLRQLVVGSGGIPEPVVQGFRNQQKVIGGRGLQVSGILKMFQAITATRRTFICVDALDECVHRLVVLESLGQILRESPNTRLFMTGRPQVRIEVERKLGMTAAFISIQSTEDDIVRYLREKLKNDSSLDIMSATLEANILESIPEISSETFLLASLSIDAILRETTIARRARRLKSMIGGAGLGDAYSATLERINAQDEEKTKLAIATLTWICHAERPLRVDELCNALAVEIGATDFDPENVPSIGTLLSCCQGLITVDKEASTVRLIHFTVQEYLRNHPGFFSKPHSILAETCLTYLNSQQVKSLSSNTLPDTLSVPFLKYSSRYWGTHASKELSDHTRTLALELLNEYEDHVSAISLCKQLLRRSSIRDAVTSPLFSGLHCASFFGIAELVAALVNTKACGINQRDCTGRTPLFCAARGGHEGVVRLLLEQQNVDPNIQDRHGLTPLCYAARRGREGVVKLLLEREDIDSDRPDDQYRTPLWWSANNGYAGVVRLLLDRRDVGPNRSDITDETPLGCASRVGYEGVVKLLLEREDVDPDRPDNQDRTPLYWAANEGHEGVVGLLLDRKELDPNHPDENGQTPLARAAGEQNEGVVKLLLEREDVDPDRPDNQGCTPLWWTANNGHTRAMRLLLGHKDVDPNRPNEDRQTPLGCAAAWGYKGVVKLLLEQENIDPNRLVLTGETPLGCAARVGNEGVVKLLLEREDVDPDRPDDEDCTPLWWTANYGYEGVVRLLLDCKDVDPDRPGKYGQTPLTRAAVEGREGVVKLLLEREDVDPDRPDARDRTPLFWAAINRREGVMRLLLDRKDVDPNRPDGDGQTPLTRAAVKGHEGVVKLLLERKDVRADRPDDQNCTPLWCAANNGHEGVMRLLLYRQDVDPNRAGGDDRTPLECAAARGHEAVVKLLLERESVNPHRPGKRGGSPLSSPTTKGHKL